MADASTSSLPVYPARLALYHAHCLPPELMEPAHNTQASIHRGLVDEILVSPTRLETRTFCLKTLDPLENYSYTLPLSLLRLFTNHDFVGPPEHNPEDIEGEVNCNSVREFRSFVVWLYHGSFTPHAYEDWDSLYMLGSRLNCASFQNAYLSLMVMKAGPFSATGRPSFPQVHHVRRVYWMTAGQTCEENSMKRFTTHCVAAMAPWVHLKQRKDEMDAWMQLLLDVPELKAEIERLGSEGGRWVVGRMPWDQGMQREYLVEDAGFKERWLEVVGGLEQVTNEDSFAEWKLECGELYGLY